MAIVIKNGKRLSSDRRWVDSGAIAIEGNAIESLDQPVSNAGSSQLVDASDCLIFPGLIDLNVSLREPGFHMKGSIATETKAAAAGGVTSVCCSPDTQPVNDSKAVTKLITELAEESGKCRVFPLGALTQGLEGERLSQHASLKSAGCIALSSGFRAIKNLEITKRCFEYAKSQDLSVFIHPIEPTLHQGAMHEGVTSTTIGLRGIPSIAETIPVAQFIQLAKATGVHLHLSNLSTTDAVKMVRQAKEGNVNVTADVAIQNLVYTDEQIVDFNSVFHCLPPIRAESDRQALLAGVRDGVIDAITSAHQPHEAAAKLMPFAETEPGMSNIELLLPMAQRLDAANELELSSFIRAMTSGPAKVLGLSDPEVAAQCIADLCVFNPDICWTVNDQNLLSLGKNTPMFNQEARGRVVATVLDGELSYQLL